MKPETAPTKPAPPTVPLAALPDDGLPPHPEVQSQSELNSTEVSPRVAKVTSLVFLVFLALVPLLDIALRSWRSGSVTVLGVFRGGSQLLEPKFLRDFERDLGDRSPGTEFFQPRLQNILTGSLGFGNDKGVVGRNGWLFYQPGIDYVIGPGILDADHLRLRTQKMANGGERDPRPDPRPAMRAFHENCRQAGVHLVLVPIPDKAQLQPAQLTRRLDFDQPMAPLNNRDYDRFLAELRAAGLDVLDVTPPRVAPGDVRYLLRDTHWTPSFMEEVAGQVADHVKQAVPLPPPTQPFAARLAPRPVARLGDIVGMLKLTKDQTVFQPQQVTVNQVQDVTTGKPWTADENADVLLLGDSFSNIYSDGEGEEGLGWGKSAGFPAHLSRALGRPVDVIARNGSGATVTRAELARRPDPLGGKRVIIWQFAARDLASENWRVVPMKAKSGATTPLPPGAVVVQARLLTPVPVDAHRTEVYANALVVLKFQVQRLEAGQYTGREVLIKFPSIINRAVQPALTALRAGHSYRLHLRTETPAQYATWQLVDDTGEFALPALWAEKCEPVP
jgi:alginate O-acetyltransferase complex protein AlgJ